MDARAYHSALPGAQKRNTQSLNRVLTPYLDSYLNLAMGVDYEISMRKQEAVLKKAPARFSEAKLC